MLVNRSPDSSEPGRRTGENPHAGLAWTSSRRPDSSERDGERVRIRTPGWHGRQAGARIRTGDPFITSEVLWPTELRRRAAIQFRRWGPRHWGTLPRHNVGKSPTAVAALRPVLGEPVAHAADRQDQLGLLGVALDLLAEVGDVHVAGPHVAGELRLPQLLHDLQTTEDLSRALGEEPQDLELRPRQVDGLAADRDQVSREVDPHRPGVDRLSLSGRGGAVELAASQLGAHASQELAHREGLGDVIVRADLQADDLVHLGVL